MSSEHSPGIWKFTAWSATELARRASGRRDVTVSIRDVPSGTPVGFDPDTARIRLCASEVGLTQTDTRVRVDTVLTALAAPQLAGMVVAGAAAAAHSGWITALPADTSEELAVTGWQLDQARAKARLLTRRRQDRLFLRAAAPLIHQIDVTQKLAAQRMTVTQLLAEIDYGVLPRWAGTGVRDQITAEFGAEVLDSLQALLQELLAVDDDDSAAILALAERWTALWPDEAPGEGGPAPSSDSDGEGGRSNEHGNEASRSDGAATAVDGEQTAAGLSPESVAAVEDLVAQIGADADAEVTQREAASAAQAERNMDAGEREFACAQAGVAFGAGTRSPVTYRTPTDADDEAKRVMLQILRRAQYRAPHKVPVPVGYPTGRARTSLLMQRAAQRAQQVEVTAQPWRRRRWKTPPKPPLRAGVAVDLSGSMTSWLPSAGSAIWSLAAAIDVLGGSTAATGFAGEVVGLLAPRTAPARVPTLTARGGSDGCPGAMAAVTAAAELLAPGAAAMIVLTDGQLDSADFEAIHRHAAFLHRHHVPLLWALTGPRTTAYIAPDEAVVVENVSPAAFPALVTAALADALTQTHR